MKHRDKPCTRAWLWNKVVVPFSKLIMLIGLGTYLAGGVYIVVCDPDVDFSKLLFLWSIIVTLIVALVVVRNKGGEFWGSGLLLEFTLLFALIAYLLVGVSVVLVDIGVSKMIFLGGVIGTLIIALSFVLNWWRGFWDSHSLSKLTMQNGLIIYLITGWIIGLYAVFNGLNPYSVMAFWGVVIGALIGALAARKWLELKRN